MTNTSQKYSSYITFSNLFQCPVLCYVRTDVFLPSKVKKVGISQFEFLNSKSKSNLVLIFGRYMVNYSKTTIVRNSNKFGFFNSWK